MRTERDMMKGIDKALTDEGITRGTDGVLHIKAGAGQDHASAEADLTALRRYVFEECTMSGTASKIQGSGSDAFEMSFRGKGGSEWRATYESGEECGRAAPREWGLDSMIFAAAVPATETEASRTEELCIRDRGISVKITTGATDEQSGTTEITLKVELSVYRYGGGFVSDPSGDRVRDSGIMSPDLYLQIGRISGLQGTVTLVRAPEAEQQNPLDQVDQGPKAPEGVKEQTVRRGSKRAVAAFETALACTTVDGQAADVNAVRNLYESDHQYMLRTWEGGPVKVVKAAATVYVLTMPAAPEGESTTEG